MTRSLRAGGNRGKPRVGAGDLFLRPANFLQCFFSQNMGMAFAALSKVDDLSLDCSPDALVTISGSQGYGFLAWVMR
jgi:hypothetical protein